MPQSAAAFDPSRLVGEQMPENGPHTEMGSKPKLNPRATVAKEEDWKSLRASAQDTDEIPVIGLLNPASVK